MIPWPGRRRKAQQPPPSFYPCDRCAWERACTERKSCARRESGIERLTGQLSDVNGQLRSTIIGYDRRGRPVYTARL